MDQKGWSGGMKPEDMTAEQAIESALACAHLSVTDKNYYKAINDLINWHIAVELDPLVSSTPVKIIKKFLNQHVLVELYIKEDETTMGRMHLAFKEMMRDLR